MVFVAVAVVVRMLLWWLLLLWRRWRSGGGGGSPFNDLIQLTPVEPYTAALWTIIDFNSLAVGHDQIDVAGGAFHCESDFQKTTEC